MAISLTVIIPTLNEAGSIRNLLETIKSFGETLEIVVVDGGSRDHTVRIAEAANVKVLTAPRSCAPERPLLRAMCCGLYTPTRFPRWKSSGK